MYDSIFYETCVAKLDNVELNLKVSKKQKKIESLRLVRVELNENVVSLEAQVKILNERGFV